MVAKWEEEEAQKRYEEEREREEAELKATLEGQNHEAVKSKEGDNNHNRK